MSEYQSGFDQGKKDNADDTIDLSDKQQIAIWKDASADWKQGWSDGFETAARNKQGPLE